MSETLKQVERTQSPAIHAPLLKEILRIPARVPGSSNTPKVLIQGDIRLRVTESYAALSPVKGHYRIETEGMQEPLHVIWMAGGNVLSHTVHAIDVAFDLRGIPAGETLTQVLTAQVTDRNGQGCVVHSSIFVQIFVIRDPVLNNTSL